MTELSLSGAALVDASTKLSKVMEPSDFSDFGKYVLIEASDSLLRLTSAGPSARLSIFLEIQPTLTEEIATLVWGDLFLGVLSKLPKLPTEMKFGRQVMIQTEQACFQLGTHPAEDYPYDLSKIDEIVAQASIEKNELRRAFSRIGFCVTKQDSARSIAGVLVELLPGELRIVAVDDNMMAFHQLPIEFDEAVSAVVAGPFCTLLPGLAKDDGVGFLKIGRSKVYFQDESMELVGRQMIREFPPYRSVLVKPRWLATMDRAPFVSALKQAKIFENRMARAERFSFRQESLQIGCVVPEDGSSAEITVPCKYEGPDLDIHFAVVDWLRAMKSFHKDQIEIGIVGEHKPVRVDEDGFTFIIGPTLA